MKSKRCLSKFLAEWHGYFSFKSLNLKAQLKLRSLLASEEYNKISARALEREIHIGRRTIESLKSKTNEHSTKKKIGRPSKLLPEAINQILNKAHEIRRNSGCVTIKRMTKYTNEHVLQNGVIVKRDTVSRIFKKYKWRRVSTRRRQNYCLTARYYRIINNWKHFIARVIKSLDKDAVVHVMDETGIVSNMIPSYSYAPHEEKDVGIKSVADTTKDSLILTLSSNGNADAFYVPFIKKSASRNGRAGVGIDEMKAWVAHFLDYARPGDLLIMDNLAAHRNQSIVSTLKAHNLKVVFLPIRSAMHLSPLDNCFFAVLKYRLSYALPEMDEKDKNKMKEMKYNIIKRVIDEMIGESKGLKYFKHCHYDDFGLNIEFPHKGMPHTVHARMEFDFEKTISASQTASNDSIHEVQVIKQNFIYPGNHNNYSIALTALFKINPTYRTLIKAANRKHQLISKLDAILDSSNIKVNISPVFNEIGEIDSLAKAINFFNHATDNKIEFYNKTRRRVDYETSIEIHDDIPMNNNPFGEIVINTPSCLTVFINETLQRAENFTIKRSMHIVTDDGIASYVLTGIIIKDQNNEYKSISETEKGNWYLYDHGYKNFDFEELIKYDNDIGEGQVVLCFYKFAPWYVDSESTNDDYTIQSLCEKIDKKRSIPIIIDGDTEDSESKDCTSDKKESKLTEYTNKKKKHMLPGEFVMKHDKMHFKRFFNPYWNYPTKEYIGIRNLEATCHLNVVLQFLFSLKIIRKKVQEAASLDCLPAKLLNDIFCVLEEDNAEYTASTVDLVEFLNIPYNQYDDAVETLEKIINILHPDLEMVGFDLKEVFEHDYYAPGKKVCSALRPQARQINIESYMINFIISTCFPSPVILYVHLTNPTYSREVLTVPTSFKASRIEEEPVYNIYAIIAYAGKHFVLFIKHEDNWVAFNDEYSYEIPNDEIIYLFGSKKGEISPFITKTQQLWLAYVVFYKKEGAII